MKEYSGPLRYVKIMKKLFWVFAAFCLPALMVCLVFAFSGAMAFVIIAPAVGILFLVVYALYAVRISMGVVIGMEVTDKVVHIKTNRKTFTYDVHGGCIAVKSSGSKYICKFRTQNSADSFIFFRRAPFSKPSDSQFSADALRPFFPRIDELKVL